MVPLTAEDRMMFDKKTHLMYLHYRRDDLASTAAQLKLCMSEVGH